MKPNEQIVLPDEMLSVLTNPLHVGLFVELLKRADESGNVEVSERALASGCDIGRQVVKTFLKKCLLTQLLTHAVTQRQPTQPNTYLIVDYWNYKRKKTTANPKLTHAVTQRQPTQNILQPDTKPGRTTKLRKLRDASENQAYINFCNWIEGNAPCVCNNIAPLTEEQFMNLKSDFGAKLIAQCVEDLENRKDLRTKYSSLYMTLIKWCKRRQE